MTSKATIKYIIQDSVMPMGHMTLALAASKASHIYILKKDKNNIACAASEASHVY